MSLEMATKHIALELIRIDGGTQPRAEVNQEVIREYAQDMLLGVTFPPVILFYDGSNYWLADGFHRYHAAMQSCHETIAADVRQGTRRDAVLFSVGANASHGLRRTNKDKQRAVETLLRDEQWAKWSDREIARRCGVSHNFVNTLRPSLSSNDSEERTYITKHGTEATMNTANIGQQQNLTPQQFAEEVFPGFTQWQQDNIDIGLTEWADPLLVNSEEEDEEEVSPYEKETEEEAFHRQFADILQQQEKNYPVTLARDEPEPQVVPPVEEDAKEKHDAHVMRVMGSSDSPEWYTPRNIVDLVCQMFGTIDTDPCSNSHESPMVPARILYTKEDDGLSYTWTGKTYLNPPYGTEISAWTDKLVDEYKAGNVTEALALLPARIDTVWFSPLYNYLMCNVRGRLQFANSPYNAPFPCVVVYLGGRRSTFIETFKKIGPIMERVG